MTKNLNIRSHHVVIEADQWFADELNALKRLVEEQLVSA